MKHKDDIDIRQWLRENYPGVRIYQTTYTHFEFPRHFHNYYTFQVVDEGVNLGFTEHHHYQLATDDVLIINPGEIHAGASADRKKLRFSVMTVEEDVLRDWLGAAGVEVSGDIIFENRPISDKVLAATIRSWIRCFKEASDPTLMDLSFTTCLQRLARYLMPGTVVTNLNDERKQYLKKAKAYIRNNFTKEITLAEIATNSGVSEYHLLREFKSMYKLTPFEYLRNYRVEKARTLLTENLSVTKVALQVGFYDHSHFLKNFKRITGMLPSQTKR